MIRARVMTQWTPDPVDGSNGFQLWNDLQAAGALTPGDTMTDATNQPGENIAPNPNVVIVEIVCAQPAYDAIIASPAYGIGAVLWSEQL